MAGRSPLSRRRALPQLEDLNLTPMMNLFITLIPVLLASVAMVRVGMLDVPIPKVVASSEAAPTPRVPFMLKVQILPYGLVVQSNGIPSGKAAIPHLPEGEVDAVSLHNLLVGLKSRFPSERSLTLLPADVVSYQKIVNVMDASRELLDMDPVINNAKRPTWAEIQAGAPFDAAVFELFPDVIMGGTM